MSKVAQLTQELKAATKTANKYPSPKEVSKAAKKAADSMYKARRDAIRDAQSMLQYAYEDARGTGVAFKGVVADKFLDRLKMAKDKLYKLDWAMGELASMLEALARDLSRES